MAVNVRGPFLCCRAVLPHMKARGYGKIVNISSGTFFSGRSQHAVRGVEGRGRRHDAHALARGRRLQHHGQLDCAGLNSQRPGARRVRTTRDASPTAPSSASSAPKTSQARASSSCPSDSDFMTGQTMIVDGGAALN